MSNLDAAKRAVMERMHSREVQHCLPVGGWTIVEDTVLFNNVEPGLALEAFFALVDDDTLAYDRTIDLVDIQGRRLP